MKTLLNMFNEILLFIMLKRNIKKDQILDYLSKNPNFFIENQDILTQINFPLLQNKNNNSEKIVSFKDWIILNLKKVQKNIIDNAEYNFSIQNKIHDVVLKIIKKRNIKEFFYLLNVELPGVFELEIVNVVTSDYNFSEKFNLIFKDKESIREIYGHKNKLVMDAVENQTNIFESKNKIYSNAIFSLDKSIFKSQSLLVFGSKDKHFVDNRAFDLIFFLSNVMEEKLIQLSNE